MRKQKNDHFYLYVQENTDGQSFELSGKIVDSKYCQSIWYFWVNRYIAIDVNLEIHALLDIVRKYVSY
jgi:hypothetical protein